MVFDSVCWFWKNGTCLRGDNCAYLHTGPGATKKRDSRRERELLREKDRERDRDHDRDRDREHRERERERERGVRDRSFDTSERPIVKTENAIESMSLSTTPLSVPLAAAPAPVTVGIGNGDPEGDLTVEEFADQLKDIVGNIQAESAACTVAASELAAQLKTETARLKAGIQSI